MCGSLSVPGATKQEGIGQSVLEGLEGTFLQMWSPISSCLSFETESVIELASLLVVDIGCTE